LKFKPFFLVDRGKAETYNCMESEFVQINSYKW